MNVLSYDEPLSEEGRFYSLALRSRRSESETEWLASRYRLFGADRVLQNAEKLKILAATVATLVEELNVSEPRVLQLYETNRKRVLATAEALSKLGDLTPTRGISWALIESGGVLFSSDLPWAALGSGDVDILVAPEHEDAFDDTLRQLGFTVQDRGGPRVRNGRVSFHKPGPAGTTLWLERSSSAFERAWVPPAFRIDERSWLAAARSSARADKVNVLEPEDLLVQVALHTSTHSYILSPGARLCIDVDRLVTSHPSLDWERFVATSMATGAPTRILLSLLIARALCATPVPQWVIDRLTVSKPRAAAALALLSRYGCLGFSAPMFGRSSRVTLSALVHDLGPLDWLQSAVFPPRQWMVAQLAAPLEDVSTPRLHLRRIRGWLGQVES